MEHRSQRRPESGMEYLVRHGSGPTRSQGTGSPRQGWRPNAPTSVDALGNSEPKPASPAVNRKHQRLQSEGTTASSTLARTSSESKSTATSQETNESAISYVAQLRRLKATVWCDYDRRVPVDARRDLSSYNKKAKASKRSGALSRVFHSTKVSNVERANTRSIAPQHASLRPRLSAAEAIDDDDDLDQLSDHTRTRTNSIATTTPGLSRRGLSDGSSKKSIMTEHTKSMTSANRSEANSPRASSVWSQNNYNLGNLRMTNIDQDVFSRGPPQRKGSGATNASSSRPASVHESKPSRSDSNGLLYGRSSLESNPRKQGGQSSAFDLSEIQSRAQPAYHISSDSEDNLEEANFDTIGGGGTRKLMIVNGDIESTSSSEDDQDDTTNSKE